MGWGDADISWLLYCYGMFKVLHLILNLLMTISMVTLGLLFHLSYVHVQSGSCLSVGV